jgi:hypothetical protein
VAANVHIDLDLNAEDHRRASFRCHAILCWLFVWDEAVALAQRLLPKSVAKGYTGDEEIDFPACSAPGLGRPLVPAPEAPSYTC